ncbi:MAG TPA: lipocalin family protein [Chryseosolibacter sp.]|nr:lipocalin family protein [Chryseosolibacter sp.]
MMHIWNNKLIVITAIMCLVACSRSENLTAEEKIAGKDEKTWKAKRETDATGDVDRLSRDEKRESITFWRNGNVKMGNGDQVMSGQWSLEGNNLRLQFTGSDVSENFTVLKLDKDQLRLRAGDGSELVMKPK